MTSNNRTKRLAREIQRDKGVPYMVALREAKAIIEAKHAAENSEDGS